MVNRIPAYMISSDGVYAVLVSRSHPSSANIMAPACQQALESCGADGDDIYIIDCPSDIVLPGLARETAKTGLFSAVIALAALQEGTAVEAALTAAMATTDFEVPVIPALVRCTTGDACMAQAGEQAGRAAVELSNLATLLEEFAIASSVDILEELEDEIEATHVRELSPHENGHHETAGAGRRGRSRTAATATKTAKAAGNATTSKRRGRPPKSAEQTSAKTVSAANTARGGKRRGRPPKSGEQTNAKTGSKTTGKKRGRPKKNG